MSDKRTIRKVNFRVEVTARRGLFWGYDPVADEGRDLRHLERIKEEVKRHVQDWGSVEVRFDEETRCSTYEDRVDDEGDSRGRWPECCGEDQQAFYDEHAEEPDDWFLRRGITNPDYLQEFRSGHKKGDER